MWCAIMEDMMECKRLYRTTTLAERQRFVVLWLNGSSARTIAQQTGMSATTVCRWIKRWRQENNLLSQPRKISYIISDIFAKQYVEFLLYCYKHTFTPFRAISLSWYIWLLILLNYLLFYLWDLGFLFIHHFFSNFTCWLFFFILYKMLFWRVNQ